MFAGYSEISISVFVKGVQRVGIIIILYLLYLAFCLPIFTKNQNFSKRMFFIKNEKYIVAITTYLKYIKVN